MSLRQELAQNREVYLRTQGPGRPIPPVGYPEPPAMPERACVVLPPPPAPGFPPAAFGVACPAELPVAVFTRAAISAPGFPAVEPVAYPRGQADESLEDRDDGLLEAVVRRTRRQDRLLPQPGGEEE